MTYSEQPIGHLSASKIMSMTVPKQPVGIEFTIIPDVENEIVFGIFTHYASIVYVTIPIWYSFHPDIIDSAGEVPNGNPFRLYCRNNQPVVRADRFDRLYVMNHVAGQSGIIYLTLGN